MHTLLCCFCNALPRDHLSIKHWHLLLGLYVELNVYKWPSSLCRSGITVLLTGNSTMDLALKMSWINTLHCNTMRCLWNMIVGDSKQMHCYVYTCWSNVMLCYRRTCLKSLCRLWAVDIGCVSNCVSYSLSGSCISYTAQTQHLFSWGGGQVSGVMATS